MGGRKEELKRDCSDVNDKQQDAPQMQQKKCERIRGRKTKIKREKELNREDSILFFEGLFTNQKEARTLKTSKERKISKQKNKW